jgi:hypothetical protein
MWFGEPTLILATSTIVFGFLFAICRILARAPAESSSDCTTSDAHDSRGIAGVIAPPPLVFLGFLALAAILEAVVPTPATNFFPLCSSSDSSSASPECRVCVAPVPTSPPICPQRHWWSTAYRWSRNPLYLAMTLAYGGLAIAAGSVWAIVLLIPLLVAMNIRVISREERYLEREFGDAYRAYKWRVRRWL